MKRILALICALAVSLMFISVSAAAPMEFDFDNGELPGTLTPKVISLGMANRATVSVEGGRLLLLSDNTGSSSLKLSHVSTAAVDTGGLMTYFKLETDANADKGFGFMDGTTDVPVFTIKNLNVAVGGANVFTLEASREYSFGVAFSNDKIIIVIDDAIVFDGTISKMPQGSKPLYFSNQNTTVNVKSELYIDDLLVLGEGEYIPLPGISQNQMVTEVRDVLVSFGTPLLKTPSVLLKQGTAEIECEVSFLGDSLIFGVKDGESLQAMQSCTLLIDDIYDIHGVKKAAIEIEFSIAGEDYTPPEVSVVPFGNVVRPGQSVTITANALSENTVTKITLMVNGSVADEVLNPAGAVNFSYRFAAEGIYEIEVLAEDNLGGVGRSDKITVTAAPSRPPSVNILNLPEAADVTELHEIRAEITDDMAVSGAQLYINGKAAAADVSVDGNIYTFSDFEKVVGDMRVSVVAYDNDGFRGEASALVITRATTMQDLVKNDMETKVPSSSGEPRNVDYLYTFEQADIKDAGGGSNKAMKITRGPAVTSGSAPYTTQPMNGRSGFFGLNFDIYLPQFDSTGFSIVTRGMGANDWPISVRSNDASLQLYNGSTPIAVDGLFEAEKWYSFKYECDTNTMTYWFYINGEMITPEEGYAFQKPLTSNGLLDLRIQYHIPVSQSIYIDNIHFYVPASLYITGAEGSGKNIGVTPSEALDWSSLSGNVFLYQNDVNVPIDAVAYDGSINTIKVTTKEPVITSTEYKIVFGKGVRKPSGGNIEYEMVKYFMTESSEFDVLSVDFEVDGSKTGAKAKIQNLTDEARTIVMVMVLKDERGAVESVHSSEVVTLAPQTEEQMLQIAPTENLGLHAEVFFLKDWAGSKCAKSAIYQQ